MRAKDIHAAVEMSLEAPVAWSSVKASLAANASGTSPRFVRVRAGGLTATESAEASTWTWLVLVGGPLLIAYAGSGSGVRGLAYHLLGADCR